MNTIPIGNDEVKEALLNVARTLALIPIDELRTFVREQNKMLSEYGGLGPLLDFTGWNNAHEDMGLQNQIINRLLAVREVIEQRDSAVRQRRMGRG